MRIDGPGGQCCARHRGMRGDNGAYLSGPARVVETTRAAAGGTSRLLLPAGSASAGSSAFREEDADA